MPQIGDLKMNILNFNVEGYMTLDELWRALEKLSTHIVEDNSLSEVYPIDIRDIQLTSIRTIIDCIEETHTVLKKHNHI
jgi:hypothetical protein